MVPEDLIDEATALLVHLRSHGLMIATAESCTGGLIAGTLTEIPGSSDVVERGFVTYSNEAKTEMLGVPAFTIDANGAVSEPVARAMAAGALKQSHADIAVAVTGVAGPGGGTVAKPVGLVHVAVASLAGADLHRACHFGDIGRGPIRLATIRVAFEMVRAAAPAATR